MEPIKTNIDLIPDKGYITGSYLCTWWNQSKAAAGLGLTGTGLSEWRDALSYDALFGEKNFYHIVPRELRSGLIFLLDDGWDLPLGTPNDNEHRYLYGAVDPDSVKFAQFGDTPAKRLKGISDKLKEMGYAGLGLWISPQMRGETEYGAEVDLEEARLYWEERAKWCNYAGVLYWKVDWGNHDADDEYRRIMTECAHKYAPELMVEHAVIQMPCTHQNRIADFAEERPRRVKEQMKFSDVYRTYDLLEPFDKVCTLQRAHEALLASDKSSTGLGLVNAENIYTIAATLGFTAGIMNYTSETAPCLKWHRIAPPFGINEASYAYSDERLEDSLYFEAEICDWAPCKDKTVKESAPAIMARGCPLPTVLPCGDNAPFIIASKNPRTNAYSIASIRRTVDPNQAVYFLADVTAYNADVNAPIGVFGVFNRLTVELEAPLKEDARVLMQNFYEDTAFDVTEMVEKHESSISFDGKLLRKLGKTSVDVLDPAVVIKIV